jgi:hypothetical protein
MVGPRKPSRDGERKTSENDAGNHSKLSTIH